MGMGCDGFTWHNSNKAHKPLTCIGLFVRVKHEKKVCLQQKASGNYDYSALKRNIQDFLAPSFVQFQFLCLLFSALPCSFFAHVRTQHDKNLRNHPTDF